MILLLIEMKFEIIFFFLLGMKPDRTCVTGIFLIDQFDH